MTVVYVQRDAVIREVIIATDNIDYDDRVMPSGRECVRRQRRSIWIVAAQSGRQYRIVEGNRDTASPTDVEQYLIGAGGRVGDVENNFESTIELSSAIKIAVVSPGAKAAPLVGMSYAAVRYPKVPSAAVTVVASLLLKFRLTAPAAGAESFHVPL